MKIGTSIFSIFGRQDGSNAPVSDPKGQTETKTTNSIAGDDAIKAYVAPKVHKMSDDEVEMLKLKHESFQNIDTMHGIYMNCLEEVMDIESQIMQWDVKDSIAGYSDNDERGYTFVKHSHDSDGRLTKTSIYNVTGTVEREICYENDENDKSRVAVVYDYNEDGKVIRKSTFNPHEEYRLDKMEKINPLTGRRNIVYVGGGQNRINRIECGIAQRGDGLYGINAIYNFENDVFCDDYTIELACREKDGEMVPQYKAVYKGGNLTKVIIDGVEKQIK